jgi:hypothetical protein
MPNETGAITYEEYAQTVLRRARALRPDKNILNLHTIAESFYTGLDIDSAVNTLLDSVVPPRIRGRL